MGKLELKQDTGSRLEIKEDVISAQADKNSGGESEDELEAVKRGWKFCKQFLVNLNKLSTRKGNGELKNLVNGISEELTEYVDERRGTKPKLLNHKEKQKVDKEVIDDSDSEDSTTSKDSSESSSIVGEIGTRKKKITSGRKMPKREENVNLDTQILINLIKKLDNRAIPQLEKFEEGSSMSLERYLEEFEEYYHENYRGRKYFWLNELEKKLSGRTLEGYRSIRQADDEYEVVKMKLLRWYDEEKELRKKSARKKFDQARMKERESVLMYSNRLLSMFKIAFPKKNYESSETLMNRFRDTIPRKMKNIVDSQMFNLKLVNKKMSFEKIQKCARLFDVENGENFQGQEETVVEEIEINLTNPVKNEYYNHDRKGSWGENKDSGYKQEYANRQYYKYPKTTFEPPTQTNYNCSYCGRYGHGFEDCRTRLRSCYKCGNQGHFARDCRENNGVIDGSRNQSPRNSNQRSYSYTHNHPQISRSNNTQQGYYVDSRRNDLRATVDQPQEENEVHEILNYRTPARQGPSWRQ